MSSQPSLSAYMQCYAQPRATFEALRAFREHYPEAKISLVSDHGEDFALFAPKFDLAYTYAPEQCCPKGYLTGIDSAYEYLRRIYEHCLASNADWVVLLEDDVLTKRRAVLFPETTCAGARSNPCSGQLSAYLNLIHNTQGIQHYYGLCGGSCFHRATFLECYHRLNDRDLRLLNILDEKVFKCCDVLLTCLFLLQGYTYSEWAEVSELSWPRPEWRVARDAAFDHADKRYYNQPLDPSCLGADTPSALIAKKERAAWHI